MKTSRLEKLKRLLDALVKERLGTPVAGDPFRIIQHYQHPRDHELASLIVCLLDFGDPKQKIECQQKLFNRLGDKPARVLARANRNMLEELSKGLAFSFLEDQDILLLLHVLRYALKQNGSLEECYLVAAGGAESNRKPLQALDRFMIRLAKPLNEAERARPGLGHLLPRPARGSTVRRLHLFMRHMVRAEDAGDAGLWKLPHPRKLQLPLTKPQHGYLLQLKLSTREICNRGAVAEASRNLILLDPDDPIRYSLALELLEARNTAVEELQQLFRKA